LTAMGISVGLLWGCLISERVITRNAVRERTQVVRELERMRLERRETPLSVPVSHRLLRAPMTRG
jgi:hypothetical protein